MMRTLVGLLVLQLCAGLRTGKDASRLTDDSCTCLSWKEVYANGNADCGDAFEFAAVAQMKYREQSSIHRLLNTNESTDVDAGYPSTAQAFMGDSVLKKSVDTKMQFDWCDAFFKSIWTNTCIKVAPSSSDSEWFGQSWCYVSSQCQNLNGGVRVEGKAVSAKFCTVDEDERLSDKLLSELNLWQEDSGSAYGARHNGKMGLIVKLAYPYLGEDFKDMMESPYYNMSLKEIQENKAIDVNMKHRLIRLKEARMEDVHYVYDYQGYDDFEKYVIYGNSTHHIWKYRSNCVDGCTITNVFGTGFIEA